MKNRKLQTERDLVANPGTHMSGFRGQVNPMTLNDYYKKTKRSKN